MASPFTFAFRGPALTYQRHREAIENALVAAALALVVGLFLDGSGAFPQQWRTVLLLTIFAAGSQSRAWGYYAAVATLLWPLWNLSPYLMTLFLMVALLPRTWIIEALPWALLVASAPLLAEWQVVGIVPLMAGLVAGPGAGLWAGALAALWLKLAAGMAGWFPELGALHGVGFTLAAIGERVSGASSLETLTLLAAPFARSSFMLLLHLLQVAAWGLAGWLVGTIRFMEWRREAPSFILAPALGAGTLVLWTALYLLPTWLEVQPLTRFMDNPMPTAGLALSALTAALAATIYGSLQRPVPKPVARPRPRGRRLGREGMVPASGETTQPPRSWPDAARAEEDDLIMLELD